MVTNITATFEHGVLKPDQPLQLPAKARVRLTVERLESEPVEPEAAWAELEELWNEITVDSGGERLTRDQLHGRR